MNCLEKLTNSYDLYVVDGAIRKGDSDVGDIIMLVTLWRWPIWDIGGRIIMLATFFNVLNRSPTS